MKFMIVFIVIAVAASVASAAPAEEPIPILRQESDINPDGSYSFGYETANGISAEESGVGGVSAHGSAKWESPEGPVEFQYTADENGYRATGSGIHPIPDAILRALEWNAAHPEEVEA